MWEHNPNRHSPSSESIAEGLSYLNLDNRSKEAAEPVSYRLFICTLLLLLSLEWIYPVTSSGQQGSERFLLVMAGLTGALLVVGLFRTGWIAGTLIRLCIAFVALCCMYGGQDPLGWGITYPEMLMSDLDTFMQSGHFYSISTETRGFCMMLGWSMLITSVQSLFLLRLSVMLFGGATLVYLLLLESLAGLDVYTSIVRSVLWIMLIQALLQLLRLSGGVTTPRYALNPYGRWSIVTVLAAIAMISFSGLPGHYSSISQPERISLNEIGERLAQWAGYNAGDSIPAAASVTGYSTADAPMGAPLTQGDTVFFVAKSPEPTYWRGETRSYYNGSTWSDPAQSFETASPSGLLRTDGWENQNYWTRILQTVTMQREWKGPNPLFTGGMPLNVSFQDRESVNEKTMLSLLSNRDSATLWLSGSGRRVSVKRYTADVMIPTAEPEHLRLLEAKHRSKDPAEIRRTYLQLPDSLPGRVRSLAGEIIKGSKTRYDAVHAVQTYLANHAEYTLDTRMPPRGTDFVDDFLFVTKQGYCNHFSTAMVVLLRAEGIPARWVKGFGTGQLDPKVPGQYSITQGDAHSWVEVYFPGAGWMPFEATPGFVIPQATAGTDAEATQLQDAGVQSHLEPWSGASAWLLARAQAFVAAPWLTATALAAAAALFAAVAFGVRRLRPALPLRLLLAWPRSSFPDRERLLRAAAPVWPALARQYGPRPPGMTLREYAASPAVAAGTDSADIARFAADWERLLYGPERPLRADSLDFLRRALRLARRLPRR